MSERSGRLLEAAEAMEGEMLAELKALVELESPTGAKAEIAAVAKRLRANLEELGFAVDIIAGGDQADHLRAVRGSGTGGVLILSHMDTVWPLGTLEHQPLRRDGDILYGPGTADMKGGIVVALAALRLLTAHDRMPEHQVTVLLTSDEEVGSVSSRPHIEAAARESRRVLVTEPGEVPNEAVKTQRKGTGMYDITVTGIRSHAGAAHEAGASAISELARQIRKLDALTDYSRGITVNVGEISGGQARNVVAGEARASVDLRVTSDDDAERLDKLIRSLEPEDERTSIRVTGGMSRPPMQRSEGVSALYRQARSLAAQLSFELPEVGSGGGSDGNFTAALGVPTLDGLGVVGAGIHAVDEHIVVSSLARRAALMALLIESPEFEPAPGAGR